MTFRCSENITAAHWEVSYIAGQYATTAVTEQADHKHATTAA